MADLPMHVTQITVGGHTTPKNQTHAAAEPFPPNMHSSFERGSMLCPKATQGHQYAKQKVPHPPVYFYAKRQLINHIDE
jgi:hypothetical protein